jgi:glycosyltransferase involved in cell wall biosynthesis
MRLLSRVRGVVARLLRAPAENHRRFDETSNKLDELRAGQAELQASVPGSLAAIEAQLDAMAARVTDLELRVGDAVDVGHRARADLQGIAATTAHVAQVQALGELPARGAEGPLVSIVVPCRDRAASLQVALRSVLAQTYERWECLVVDDGSEDDLAKAVDELGADPRIRVLTNGGGVAAARNHGVAAATGSIITFLDSDNWWLPRRLEAVVAAFEAGATWSVDRQLVLEADGRSARVRSDDEPLERLGTHNFIDLGSVAVSAGMLRAIAGEDGPFDTTLARLSDWALIRRLAAVSTPVRIPHLGQVYDQRDDQRISVQEPFGPAYHQIRREAVGQPGAGLRVLLAEWHFPQLTETYIQSDVVGLCALGVTVEAWSEEEVEVPYEPGIPVHRGSLAAAVEAFRPDLVLSHWLHVGRDHRATTRALGVPHAVRGHGFDHDEAVIDELCREPGLVVHLFPHLGAKRAGHPAVSIDPVGFDPARVKPSVDTKDRRLVLRIAAGLLTKDLDVFFHTAARCPDHRFVLVLGHSYQVAERTEVIRARAAELDAPVDVRVDLPHAEAAALTEQAGVYLHTHGEDHPVGMPVSIAESMATGAYVLARDLPGVAGYGRDGVALYRGATVEERADHAAALINATLAWDEPRWRAAGRAALDVAWVHHPADLVAARLLEVWRERLGVGAGARR